MRDLIKMKLEKLVPLYTGSASSSLTLSQSRKNFKYLRLKVGYGNDGYQSFDIPTSHNFIYIELPAGAGNDVNKIITCYKWVSDTQLTSQAAKLVKLTRVTSTSYTCTAVTSGYTFSPILTIWGIE